ncbi:MAG: tryptophan synthase subunit alpha [Candidatus Atribacteria bacterium]|jgi:tryptophan synthase alpha chain|nr:tryptophan synthase subunit alpha [Candidatus Atribacteria bacterium]
MQIIPYILFGFPTLINFLKTVNRLLEYPNVPYVEIGVPSNNPYMDGLTIKNCHEVVREKGFNLRDFINFLTKKYPGNAARKLILMGYPKDIDNFGLQKFKKEIKTCKIAGCIIINNTDKVIDYANYIGVPAIPIVTVDYDETTLNAFMKTRPPFIYFKVSSGKTGKTRFFKRHILSKSLQNIRKNWPTMKIFAGFGIENISHAKLMKEIGFDGIIIGSALLKIMAKKKSIYNLINELGEI